MQEATSKVMANRTDFAVGVEGYANKAAQAQNRIKFGIERGNNHRTRDTYCSIGPDETKDAYVSSK